MEKITINLRLELGKIVVTFSQFREYDDDHGKKVLELKLGRINGMLRESDLDMLTNHIRQQNSCSRHVNRK